MASSYPQDGNDQGVYAQIYVANGAPVGGEFQVNTYALNGQFGPSITGLPTGGFLVTWASYGQDGDGNGVYGKFYDSDGVPQGTEFLVNSHIPEAQQNPSVAALPSGGVVVAWESSCGWATSG